MLYIYYTFIDCDMYKFISVYSCVESHFEFLLFEPKDYLLIVDGNVTYYWSVDSKTKICIIIYDENSHLMECLGHLGSHLSHWGEPPVSSIYV